MSKTILFLLLFVSTISVGQVSNSEDLETITKMNELFNTQELTFIQTTDSMALDIIVHNKKWSFRYYQTNILPLINPIKDELYSLGYVYVKMRFTNGKHFYDLTD